MLKAIHAREDRKAAEEKIQSVITKLEKMKLKRAAGKVRDRTHETLSYCHFPSRHRRSIKTNNPTERIMREIRRRHISGTKRETHRYLNMAHLIEIKREDKTG